MLDVACGTGLGLDLLGSTPAKLIIGSDISLEGLAQARQALPRQARLCQADAESLPFRSGAFDVVTSFETLEHLSGPERFLDEVRRVLAPGGLLLLSTPNALFTRPVEGRPRNPFHVHEFTPDELRRSLALRFSTVELLGQRPDPRLGPSPYWELPGRLPRDARSRLWLLAWRIQSRLPTAIREALSHALRRRSFYPGEREFVFSAETVPDAHVTFAICRP